MACSGTVLEKKQLLRQDCRDLRSNALVERAIEEFEEFCLDRYSSLDVILSSAAKFEVWAYTKARL